MCVWGVRDASRASRVAKNQERSDGRHFEKEREPGCVHMCVCVGENSPGALKNALLCLYSSLCKHTHKRHKSAFLGSGLT